MKPIFSARHRSLAPIIQHAVWLYLRFKLSLRDIEDLLAGHDVCRLTLALKLLIGEFDIRQGKLSAGSTVAALPVTILFLFSRQRLVGGLTAGAVRS